MQTSPTSQDLEPHKCSRPWTAFLSYPLYPTNLQRRHSSHLPRTTKQHHHNNNISLRNFPKSSLKSNHDKHATQPTEPTNLQPLQQPHNEQSNEQPSPFLPSEFAFALTLLVTAAAGGPVLASWGLLFLLLGKYTGTPAWLQALSTFIFAGITDTLTYNWSSFSFDSGYTPYLVFFLGAGVTAVYDASSLFPMPGEVNAARTRARISESETCEPLRDTVVDRDTNYDEDFAHWDQAFRETHRDNDPDS